MDGERGIQRLLVYEFMPNKSLEDHLFSKSREVLPWKKRLQIMLGAAQGLAYLHEELEAQVFTYKRDHKQLYRIKISANIQSTHLKSHLFGLCIQVIFRDFKTSNILLDEDFNPKLSDFGLAREGPTEGNTHVSTAVSACYSK